MTKADRGSVDAVLDSSPTPFPIGCALTEHQIPGKLARNDSRLGAGKNPRIVLLEVHLGLGSVPFQLMNSKPDVATSDGYVRHERQRCAVSVPFVPWCHCDLGPDSAATWIPSVIILRSQRDSGRSPLSLLRLICTVITASSKRKATNGR